MIKNKFSIALITVLTIASAFSFITPSTLRAAGPATINLGSAGNFAVLAKSGISTTGTTYITGNIGISPAADSYLTGFGLTKDASNTFSTSAQVTGKIYAADYSAPTPTTMTTAINDMQAAYTNAVGRTNPTATDLYAGNLGGKTITPGLYRWNTNVTIPTDVTLAGGANDVWIFQVVHNLDIGSSARVVLTNGAQASNIFWQVSGQTTLGTGSVFNGTILGQTAIVLNSGATLNGHALAQTAVSLIASNVLTTTVTPSATPVVGSVAPTNVTVNNIRAFSVLYSGSAIITSCSLYADDQLVSVMSLTGDGTTGTASRSYTFTNIGSHTLQARCVDSTGTTGVGPITTINVASVGSLDITPPSSPSNLFRLPTGSTNTAHINWSAATDNVGVITYQISVDGQGFLNIGNTLSFTSAPLNQGNHTIAVRSQDGNGNVSNASSISFSIGAQGQVLGTTTPPVFNLDDLFSDANLVASAQTRAEFENSTGVICELPSATAASRVQATLGNNVATAAVQQAIENFMACGTRASLHLGAGERLGVVNSYHSAYGRWPSTQANWNDVLKIANGRFPTEMSATAEARAKTSFRLVYRREANLNVTSDNNATIVMAYGLRPLPRNLNSEAPAILTFRAVYGHMPSTASDWDIVRSVSYSGATR